MDVMLPASTYPAPPSGPRRPQAWQLSLAGLSAVAVSFGFARYGYGLFLPDIRADFDLSVSMVGLIGSATYVGYLAALVLVGLLAVRLGPRTLIATGGLSATLGTALVGVAASPGLLSVGLVLAGSSPGWIWAPYSDAVDRVLPAAERQRVLAVIPAGTAFGIVVAGPLALLASGSNWRFAWLLFAAGALAATLYNLRTVPGGPAQSGPAGSPDLGVRWFARRAAVPLYATALSYGVVGSIYWLLAVEAISTTGADQRTVALFWTATGVAGTAALLSGALFARAGLVTAQRLLFTSLAVAAALLGIAPGSPLAVGLSALLYGPAFMAGSALLAVWSYRVFPTYPTTGFSATVFFLGIGTVLAPAVTGAVVDRYGIGTAFLGAATVAALTLAAKSYSEDDFDRGRAL